MIAGFDIGAGVAGVAGLVSLRITVTSGLIQYCDSGRDSQDDIATMFASLTALDKLCELLNDMLLQDNFSPEVVYQVTKSVTSCEEGIKMLRSKLMKVKGSKPGISARRRLQYPFHEKTLVKLQAAVFNLRDNLNLSIDALQVDMAGKLLQKLTILNGKVDAALQRQLGRHPCQAYHASISSRTTGHYYSKARNIEFCEPCH